MLLAIKTQPVQVAMNPSLATRDLREAIDLGLSVNWAVCNVGAMYPWGAGDYFAWGETEPKDEYTVANSVTLGKVLDGEKDGWGRRLKGSNDAASAQWKGTWRMPTIREMEELENLCQWIPTTVQGQKGYQVVGPSGNSIFLPLTGYKKGTDHLEPEQCQFWGSSIPIYGNKDKADFMAYPPLLDKDASRAIGRCVRPVDGASVKDMPNYGYLTLPELEPINPEIRHFINQSVLPTFSVDWKTKQSMKELPGILIMEFLPGEKEDETKLGFINDTQQLWCFGGSPPLGCFQHKGYWIVVYDKKNLSGKHLRFTGHTRTLTYRILSHFFCLDGTQEWHYSLRNEQGQGLRE